MTTKPKLDRSLADQAMQRAAASERRYRYLTELAARHNVRLPPMYVGDEHAIDHALDALQDAGADIDWTRIDITTHPRGGTRELQPHRQTSCPLLRERRRTRPVAPGGRRVRAHRLGHHRSPGPRDRRPVGGQRDAAQGSPLDRRYPTAAHPMSSIAAQAFVGVSLGLCIVAIVYGLVTLWESR